MFSLEFGRSGFCPRRNPLDPVVQESTILLYSVRHQRIDSWETRSFVNRGKFIQFLSDWSSILKVVSFFVTPVPNKKLEISKRSNSDYYHVLHFLQSI